jgi:hypothetical protein
MPTGLVDAAHIFGAVEHVVAVAVHRALRIGTTASSGAAGLPSGATLIDATMPAHATNAAAIGGAFDAIVAVRVDHTTHVAACIVFAPSAISAAVVPAGEKPDAGKEG